MVRIELLVRSLSQLRLRAMQTASRCEHFLKHRQYTLECATRYATQIAHQTFTINRTQLVQNYMASFTFETAWHAERIFVAASCERRDDMSLHMAIQLIW